MKRSDWYFGTGLFTAGMSVAASLATWGDPAPGWFAPLAAAAALALFGLGAVYANRGR